MSLHTTGIGIGYIMCVTQSDAFRWICLTQIDRGQRRSLAMEMEVGDDGAAGP